MARRTDASPDSTAEVLSALLRGESDDTAYADDAAQRIISAALAEFTEYGFRRVKVDDIARRAGMHRVTVYRRFKNKDEIVIAATITWLSALFKQISMAVSAPGRAQEGIVEGFAMALSIIRSEPIVARALAADADYFVPLLIGYGGTTIAVVREIFARELRRTMTPAEQEQIDIDGVAELVARAGLSFVLTPESHFPLETPDDLRAFARRYLAPLL